MRKSAPSAALSRALFRTSRPGWAGLSLGAPVSVPVSRVRAVLCLGLILSPVDDEALRKLARALLPNSRPTSPEPTCSRNHQP